MNLNNTANESLPLLAGQRLLHLPLLGVQLLDEGGGQLAWLHLPLQVVTDQEVAGLPPAMLQALLPVPSPGLPAVRVLLEAVLPDGGGNGPGHEVGVVPSPVPHQVGEPEVVGSARHVGEGVVLGLEPLQGGG